MLSVQLDRGKISDEDPVDGLMLQFGYDWVGHVAPDFTFRTRSRTEELWEASIDDEPEDRLLLLWNHAEAGAYEPLEDLIELDEDARRLLDDIELCCSDGTDEDEDESPGQIESALRRVARAFSDKPSALGVPTSETFLACAMNRWVDDPLEDLEMGVSAKALEQLLLRAAQED